MLYFAYGSNMDWAQMKQRCLSARFVGKAVLRGHCLAFTRKSQTRGCGVADVIGAPGSKVWGVVYEIADIDLGKLDQCEGYQPGRQSNAYWRRECFVFVEDVNDQPLTTVSYFAEAQSNPPLPSRAYVDQIIAGARLWRLPQEYIGQLEQIKVEG